MNIVLRSGAKMPALGFGTFIGGKSAPDAYQATLTALQSGYRHIDTAQMYGTEKYVGQAIKDSGIPRDEIFLNSKIYNTCYSPELVPLALEKTLELLQTDYLDSWLMHTPWAFEPKDRTKALPKWAVDENKKPFENEDYDMLETWNVVCQQAQAGYVKDVGVSNFSTQQIDFLIKNSSYLKPSVNQVECHPYLNQHRLILHHQSRGVVVTGYGPLGGPGETTLVNGHTPINNPLVLELAEKYGKSSGQILLRFQVQRGIAVVAKSVTPSRIASNMDIYDFELETSDMQALAGLDSDHRAYTFHRAKGCKDYPF